MGTSIGYRQGDIDHPYGDPLVHTILQVEHVRSSRVNSSAPQATDHHATSAFPSRDGLPGSESGSREQVAEASESQSIGARIAAGFQNAPAERRFLWLLLVLFLAKGVIFTFIFPPFSGHDEVAHYAYIKVMVEEGRLPLIPDPVAYDAEYEASGNPEIDRIPEYFAEYQQYMTNDWYKSQDGIIRTVTYLGEYMPSGWIYTANHPPLYYLLVAPVYMLTEGSSPETQLYALRLAAIPFGLLTVLFAYLTTRRLFPRERFLAITVPTLVAFQPQIAYEAAMLNNDIVAIATTSACLYLVVVGLQNRFTVGLCAWLGLALGLAVLTKTTAVIVMPVIAIAMVLRLGWKNLVEWLPKGGLIVAITAILAAPWYGYMLDTYGSLTALDRIQTLQWWNNRDQTPTIMGQLTDPAFAWLRWRETWGEFGWRLIPLGDTLLRVLFLLFIGTLIGAAIWLAVVALFRFRARGTSLSRLRNLTANTDPIVTVTRWQVIGILAMVITCVVAYFAVLQFGINFKLTQARYYFPAVNAAALIIMLGIRMLTPTRWLTYVQTAIFIGLFWLNVIILSTYVVPYWQNGIQ